MALSSGTNLGPYEIQSPLGAGGMGEVYRARDTRLNRDVAIKVLPAAYARDPERLRRFQQEAQAVAALNHPNILAIHDFGEHEGSPYIVTEYLEGETLRARLSAGATSVRKAIVGLWPKHPTPAAEFVQLTDRMGKMAAGWHRVGLERPHFRTRFRGQSESWVAPAQQETSFGARGENLVEAAEGGRNYLLQLRLQHLLQLGCA